MPISSPAMMTAGTTVTVGNPTVDGTVIRSTEDTETKAPPNRRGCFCLLCYLGWKLRNAFDASRHTHPPCINFISGNQVVWYINIYIAVCTGKHIRANRNDG